MSRLGVLGWLKRLWIFPPNLYALSKIGALPLCLKPSMLSTDCKNAFGPTVPKILLKLDVRVFYKTI